MIAALSLIRSLQRPWAHVAFPPAFDGARPNGRHDPAPTEAQRVTRNRVASYILLAVALFLGFVILRDSAWQGTKQLHTLMEVVATCLAMFVGVMALVRFYGKKNNTFLFLGTAFLGTALLDGYHAVVTSSFFSHLFPSGLSSLIPWSWVASRAFLALLMWLSWLAWRREVLAEIKQDPALVRIPVVVLTTSAA